jgi:hypothetical protein
VDTITIVGLVVYWVDTLCNTPSRNQNGMCIAFPGPMILSVTYRIDP